MRRRSLPIVVLALVAIGCSSTAPSATPQITPAPTPTASPTPAPTPSPTPAPSGIFSGQPYTLDLPAGWTVYDLSNPASKASLDAFVAANPKMATAVKAFQSTPNVRMAINGLLGNVIVSIAIPTGGVPLDTIGQSMTAQFKAVPGVVGEPVATSVTLPAGPALHWALTISANGAGGTTTKATESIYLVTDGTNAVLVEFVAIQGAGVPQEQSIIQSLRFQP